MAKLSVSSSAFAGVIGLLLIGVVNGYGEDAFGDTAVDSESIEVDGGVDIAGKACPEWAHAVSNSKQGDYCLCNPPHVCKGLLCQRGRATHDHHTDGLEVAVTGWKAGKCKNCKCVEKSERRKDADAAATGLL
eukprot:m.80638 g.80638  ORF g.80638 m.80638 type:complete len:133 (+) comp16301_c0_seq1:242-640(+)